MSKNAEILASERGIVVQAAPTPMDLMSAMIEKGVDADQLDKMLTLQERWQANQARVSFARAMADFQARCPTIKKTKKADRYMYAPLDTILKTIRPHLERCGLSVRFDTRMTETTVLTAICTVAHCDGHSESSEFSAIVDENMRVNDTQKSGSANSYAKRYALMNALGIVASDEDDDGYAAMVQTITQEEAASIRDQLAALESDEKAFCAYMKVDAIEDIPASQHGKAISAIKAKATKAKK